jgi:hypothetical protein
MKDYELTIRDYLMLFIGISCGMSLGLLWGWIYLIS